MQAQADGLIAAGSVLTRSKSIVQCMTCVPGSTSCRGAESKGIGNLAARWHNNTLFPQKQLKVAA